MRWSEVREAHPEQWLVIEALEAHSERGRRVFDRVAVVEVCPDGRSSMNRPRRRSCGRGWDSRAARRSTSHVAGHRRREVVFVRRVGRLAVGAHGVDDFEVEVGEMSYGFGFGGIIGLDFLRATAAVLDLGRLMIELTTSAAAPA